jgi:hypothetical protein
MIVCKDCGTHYDRVPIMGCNQCRIGNIAIVTDIVSEGSSVTPDGDDISKMTKHALADLAEKVCSGPY